VRPLTVVVLDELGKHRSKVLLIQHDQVVEALAAEGPDQAFRDGVRRWRALLWAREHDLTDDDPLFFSRKRGGDGRRRAVQRGQAWLLVRQASERAEVRVLALRAY
jgi:hypothetical protein